MKEFVKFTKEEVREHHKKMGAKYLNSIIPAFTLKEAKRILGHSKNVKRRFGVVFTSDSIKNLAVLEWAIKVIEISRANPDLPTDVVIGTLRGMWDEKCGRMYHWNFEASMSKGKVKKKRKK